MADEHAKSEPITALVMTEVVLIDDAITDVLLRVVVSVKLKRKIHVRMKS